MPAPVITSSSVIAADPAGGWIATSETSWEPSVWGSPTATVTGWVANSRGSFRSASGEPELPNVGCAAIAGSQAGYGPCATGDAGWSASAAAESATAVDARRIRGLPVL